MGLALVDVVLVLLVVCGAFVYVVRRFAFQKRAPACSVAAGPKVLVGSRLRQALKNVERVPPRSKR